jgi:hypothetical protein
MPSWTPFEIRRNNVDLHNIRLPESGVQYNFRYYEFQVAHWWGLTPLMYLERPRIDRLNMLATYDAHQKVEFLAGEQARLEAERTARSNRGRR